MIGKIITSYIGGKAAQKSSALGGPAGMALGFIAPMILRRISLPAMAAMAAGGYVMKKVLDNGEREQAPQPMKRAKPVTTAPGA